MTYRLIILSLIIFTMIPIATEAQSGKRTSWGAPDLQGVWDCRRLTPLERPENLGNQETNTEEEAAEFSESDIQRRSRDNDTSGRVVPYNDFWFDEGTSVTTDRTSLIVDPPTGRLPAFTQSATKRNAELAMARKGVGSHEPPPGGLSLIHI